MPAYKFRSRGFRPKTRAMTRNNEATVAAAFFSTQDAVSIGSEDQGDQEKALAAKLIHELCNYRLAETDILAVTPEKYQVINDLMGEVLTFLTRNRN